MSEDHVIKRAQERLGRTLRQKWRLDKLLGVGGMAAVYAATHRNGKRAAVKLLHADVAMNPELRTRFLREGYVANAVEHPGSVSVLDDDTDEDGSVYLVMELLDGETLESRWERKKHKLDPGEVLSITDKLLDVLAAAHAKRIVHRDIKPENVFLTRDGVVKVLDFGIARLVELSSQTARATRAGATMGTPAYMPPEQASGDWEHVDGRSDLWTVGAMMFTCISGRFVHEGRNLNEQLIASATRPAPSLGQVAPGAPPAIVAFVDKALSFNKKDRWPDATTMQVALREAYWAKDKTVARVTRASRPDGVLPPVDKDISINLPVAAVSAIEDAAMAEAAAEGDEKTSGGDDDGDDPTMIARTGDSLKLAAARHAPMPKAAAEAVAPAPIAKPAEGVVVKPVVVDDGLNFDDKTSPNGSPSTSRAKTAPPPASDASGPVSVRSWSSAKTAPPPAPAPPSDASQAKTAPPPPLAPPRPVPRASAPLAPPVVLADAPRDVPSEPPPSDQERTVFQSRAAIVAAKLMKDADAPSSNASRGVPPAPPPPPGDAADNSPTTLGVNAFDATVPLTRQAAEQWMRPRSRQESPSATPPLPHSNSMPPGSQGFNGQPKTPSGATSSVNISKTPSGGASAIDKSIRRSGSRTSLPRLESLEDDDDVDDGAGVFRLEKSAPQEGLTKREFLGVKQVQSLRGKSGPTIDGVSAPTSSSMKDATPPSFGMTGATKIAAAAASVAVLAFFVVVVMVAGRGDAGPANAASNPTGADPSARLTNSQDAGGDATRDGEK